jgi:catechol-2,3-dioxygenase
MTVRPARISHIGLMVHDLEGFVHWYEEVLGFQVSDRMPFSEDYPYYEGVWIRCDSDHHVISVFGLRDPDPGQPSCARAGRQGLHHLAFEMASFDDLRRLARYAREQDIEIQGMRTGGPGTQLRLYLWDPAGNIVELCWAMDKVGWDGSTRPYDPVTPVDLETIDVDEWLAMKGPEFQHRAVAREPEPR